MKKVMFISMLALGAFLTISISFHHNSMEIGNPAYASCLMSDIKEKCCASACQIDKSDGRDKATAVLRSCMKSVLDCPKHEVEYATPFNRCDCN